MLIYVCLKEYDQTEPFICQLVNDMKHTGLQLTTPKGKLSQKAAIYPEETLAMILTVVIWYDKNPIA